MSGCQSDRCQFKNSQGGEGVMLANMNRNKLQKL